MTRQEAFAIISGAPLPFWGPDHDVFQGVGAVRREFVDAIELAHILRNSHPSLPKACAVLETINQRLARLLSEWCPLGPAN
jgi:hypothetical protein